MMSAFVRLFALVSPVLVAVPNCDPLAVAPSPGDFEGAWLVNEQSHASFGSGIPIVAHLQVKNVSGKRVRIPIDVAPKLREAEQAKWNLAFTPPVSLAPGERLEAVWILEKPLPPGTYNLESTTHAIVKPASASFRIEAEKAPFPLRIHYAGTAAKLSGTTAQLIEQLNAEARTSNTAPSIHLQLAELYEASELPVEAKKQYEIFAEKAYGMDPLPGWLRGKMDAL